MPRHSAAKAFLFSRRAILGQMRRFTARVAALNLLLLAFLGNVAFFAAVVARSGLLGLGAIARNVAALLAVVAQAAGLFLRALGREMSTLQSINVSQNQTVHKPWKRRKKRKKGTSNDDTWPQLKHQRMPPPRRPLPPPSDFCDISSSIAVEDRVRAVLGKKKGIIFSRGEKAVVEATVNRRKTCNARQ